MTSIQYTMRSVCLASIKVLASWQLLLHKYLPSLINLFAIALIFCLIFLPETTVCYSLDPLWYYIKYYMVHSFSSTRTLSRVLLTFMHHSIYRLFFYPSMNQKMCYHIYMNDGREILPYMYILLDQGFMIRVCIKFDFK